MQPEIGSSDLIALSVTDITDQVQTRRQLETIQLEQAQLMQELSASNKRLNDINKQLLDTNEELQVANEELVLTHEELQASIEEFETTNEELQATNEELQATNEELETTNDELRARTSELHESTTMLESERLRLTEMVEISPFYIMVLRGPTLLIEAFTHYAEPARGANVRSRPLEAVFELFWEGGISIVRLAQEVYRYNTTRTASRILTHLPDEQGGFTNRYFSYTLVPSHDASGSVSGVIIYAIDETEQQAKGIEQELEPFALLFDYTTTVALALYEVETMKLLMASPRYLDIIAGLTGPRRDSLIGCTLQKLIPPAKLEEVLLCWNTVLDNHTSVRLSDVHLRLPESEQDVVWDWSIRPIFDQAEPDKLCFILFSAIEITEQARAHHEMVRLISLRDDFLSFASHELRTPLTSITGNAELLQRQLKRLQPSKVKPEEIERGEKNVADILHQSRQLAMLIDRMLDVTRIVNDAFELQKQEHLNIVALVRQVVESQAATFEHSIKLEATSDTISGNFDESRIEQVLINLISNAIKYSPSDAPVNIGIEGKEHEVVISVQNEGAGIPAEEQSSIFERFYRGQTDMNTHLDGLGLGLYIAHEIIIRHGGQMWVESIPGDGATFCFSLPLE